MAATSSFERKVKAAELVLRSLVCVLGALAAALVATNTQTRTFFSLEKKASYTDMKSLVLLVAATGAAAGYSLLLLCATVAAMALRGSTGVSTGVAGEKSGRAVAWSVFSCDQAVAYAVMAAVAAAVQSSLLGKNGQKELQWMGICDLYGAFCRRAGEGLASAVLAALASVLVANVSAFNLFRLYGGRGKSGGAAAGNGATTTW